MDMNAKTSPCRLLVPLAFLALAANAAPAHASDYRFDTVHTQILFSVSHLGFSHPSGPPACEKRLRPLRRRRLEHGQESTRRSTWPRSTWATRRGATSCARTNFSPVNAIRRRTTSRTRRRENRRTQRRRAWQPDPARRQPRRSILQRDFQPRRRGCLYVAIHGGIFRDGGLQAQRFRHDARSAGHRRRSRSPTSKSKACATAMRRSKLTPDTTRSNDDAEERRKPLGQPGQVFPLDDGAADPASRARSAWSWSSCRNGPASFRCIQFHKSLGLTIFALAVLRLAWRAFDPRPREPAGMPRWQVLRRACRTRAAVRAVVRGAAVRLVVRFGVRTAAAVLVRPVRGTASDWRTRSRAEGICRAMRTQSLFWLLIAVAAGHAAMALIHQFVNRDNVLGRMWPGRLQRTAVHSAREPLNGRSIQCAHCYFCCR